MGPDDGSHDSVIGIATSEQTALHLSRRKHHTLKNSVPTRWNSTYLMVSSVLDLLQEVNASLIKIGKHDLRLSAVEENLLNDLRSFLAPFESYTQLVSGNQPTLSLIPLIRDAIAQHCSLNPRDHSIVKQLKGQVMANVDVRLPQDNDVLLATLLDPTTKTLPTQQLEEQVSVLKKAVQQTEAELAEHRNVDAAELAEGHPVSADAPPMSLKGKLIQSILKKRGDAVATDCVIDQEIRSYLSLKPASSHAYESADDSILNEECNEAMGFWQKNHMDYPHLQAVARRYLTISASSVPVESMFSTTGLIMNGRRSRLAPSKLNYLSFIHDNYKYL